ncbi:hypothetical protein [Pseudomonas sp.]|uniref:hypothetical protein n=1 Tax=Pseudomonas sp. TaxID=306 RepID=UPI003C61B92F
MTTQNIKRFDEYTGQIFAYLYQSFPVPTSIVPREFVDLETDGLAANKDDDINEEIRIFLATARWLVMSGYIHCREERLSYIREAVLTAKGLEILKRTPSSVEGGPSFGDRLSKAAKEEGRETMRSLVSEVLGLGAKLISPLVGLSS